MAAGGFLQSTKGGFVSAPAASGGGGSALSLSEEGSELTSAATSINVVGAALTATQSGTAITITQGSWSTGSVIGGATMTLGSDATGDTYYRAASGILTRLGAGSNTNVLTLAGGVPSWAAPAAGGSVAGSDGQLQYNNSAAFGGAAQLHYDDSNTNLGIGTSTFNASAVKTLALGNGTAPAAGTPGQCSMYAKDSAYCVLLLNMNGSNGGTTFTDSSPYNHTMTVTGDAHTDSSVKKFGSASAQFDGSGDKILSSAGSEFQFGTGDFTVEFWFRASDVSGAQVLVSHYGPSSAYSWEFYLNSNKVRFTYYTTSTTLQHGTTIAVDTWYHVAWSRVSGKGNLFVNGVGQGQVTHSQNYGHTYGVGIGTRSGSTYAPFNGYIDDVRVMKGIGLYAPTEDFTPPGAELEDGDTSELYVLDELGNETAISPHAGGKEWVFHSKNKNTGRNVKVNMERMIKRLEELHPGEKFLEEWDE
jgi:hypothetical protein